MEKKYGFSVITVTNRSYCIENIINNYKRQEIKSKELVIIINDDNINMDDFNKYIGELDNIEIYKLSEEKTLGECLNFGIEKCKHEYIAKFDDDDYYSKYYLNEQLNAFNEHECEIVGKFKVFFYFEQTRTLAEISDHNYENMYCYGLVGSSICFKKEIIKNIKFLSINYGEDNNFCKSALNYGYKIYLTSRYNHIVFRFTDLKKHTWPAHIDYLTPKMNMILKDVSFEECFEFVEKKFD